MKARTLVFKVFRIILGIILLILGVAGLFLPVLQGILFLLLGALLLSPDFPPLKKLVYSLRSRFPASKKPIRQWFCWMRRNEKSND